MIHDSQYLRIDSAPVGLWTVRSAEWGLSGLSLVLHDDLEPQSPMLPSCIFIIPLSFKNARAPPTVLVSPGKSSDDLASCDVVTAASRVAGSEKFLSLTSFVRSFAVGVAVRRRQRIGCVPFREGDLDWKYYTTLHIHMT